jgi:hypothetical protein
MKKSQIKSWYVKWHDLYWTPGRFVKDRKKASRFLVRFEAELIASQWGSCACIYPSRLNADHNS